LNERLILGQARTHSTLLPEMLDDFVVKDCTVRVIDLFVDDLNLKLITATHT